MELSEAKLALSFFDLAYKKQPDYYPALMYAGIASSKLGRGDLAKDYFDRAHNMSQKGIKGTQDLYLSTRTIELLASGALELIEQEKESRNTYAEGIRETGKKMAEFNAKSYCAVGQKWLDKGDYDGAMGWFDKAIELVPDNGDAWIGKSLVFARTNHDILAISMANKAIDLGGNPYDLARVYAILGDRVNMLLYLSSAIRQKQVLKYRVASDKDFEAFRSDEDFKKVLSDT